MKYLFIIVFFISVIGNAQDLKEIRSHYPKAVESSEVTLKLYAALSGGTAKNNPVLLAYKGAVSTLKAKFAKARSEKKEHFKEGVSLLEIAITADPSNIEIRYIRLSVQENSPKFLGYHKNIEEDKQFLLKNYEAISSTELKRLVNEFVLRSENFSESEREEFKKH